MKTKLVRIGNSRGVRIPSAFIEAVGLDDEVELTMEGSALVLRAARRPREGWAEAMKALHAAGDDELVETPPASWDDEEWASE